MFLETPHINDMKQEEQIGIFPGAPAALRPRMRLSPYAALHLPLWLLFVGLIMGMAMPAASDQTDPALDSLFKDLVRTGNKAEAEQLTSEIWSRWIASDGDADADRLMQSGMTLMNRGMLGSAEQIFSKLIQDHPDFAEAWNKRATVRFLRGNDAGSRRDIARVIDLEPRHFGALSGLGMINMRSGDLQAALQAFEAALRVNPHLDQAVDVTSQLRKQLRGQPL